MSIKATVHFYTLDSCNPPPLNVGSLLLSGAAKQDTGICNVVRWMKILFAVLSQKKNKKTTNPKGQQNNNNNEKNAVMLNTVE